MISKQDVQHIAKLARLGLKESEIKKFQKELSSILDYFAILNEANVSGVELIFHPTEYFVGEKKEILREDKEKPQTVEVVDKLIESAPDKKKGHIKVKAIL